MSTPRPDDRIPVLLLTGFLGSGKTTLLNHLLRQPDFAATAVIINEFGEIGLDHQLIAAVKDEMILLRSGCLCCTIKSDLIDTLKALHLKRVKGEVFEFGRVIIETTGLADPVPILHTLTADPLVAARYRLDGVLTTVDLVNGMATLDAHPEAFKQVLVADRLLLTKGDLAQAEAAAALRQRLTRLNPGAMIAEAAQGVADPALFAGLAFHDPAAKGETVRGWLQAEAHEAADEAAHGDHDHHHHDHDDHDHHHGHGHDHHDVNRHDAHIRAFCVTLDQSIEPSGFDAWLRMMNAISGENLLRVKAILNLAGHERPVVFHAVQHVSHPPFELDRWPDDDRRSRLVFITRDIEKSTIEGTLTAFQEGARALT